MDTGVIKKLLDPSALTLPIMASGINELQLKESDPSASLKLVRIRGVPKNTLLIKVDGASPLNSLLSAEKGIRQRCDYLVLTEKDNAPVLVYCELKSRNASASEIARQFKGGVCIVRYFDSLLEKFLGTNDYFASIDKVYFVAFSKVKGWKRGSKKFGIALNTTEEKFCKCPRDYVSLNELIG